MEVMRESMYLDLYLDETGGGHLLTPGSYLCGALKGRAKDYQGRLTEGDEP